jgi:hypothetical protein
MWRGWILTPPHPGFTCGPDTQPIPLGMARSVTPHPLLTKVHVRAMMTDLGHHGSSCLVAGPLQEPLSNRSDDGGLSATSRRTVTARPSSRWPGTAR